MRRGLSGRISFAESESFRSSKFEENGVPRSLTVALIHEVFHEGDGAMRLCRRLREARDQGAELALLPELPLQPWIPATRERREEDAEEPGGPIHRGLAESARQVGIGVMGGAIVRDPSTGRRFNRALLYDGGGRLVDIYDKLHVPCEEGFWEQDHYEPGDSPPRRVDAFDLPLGMQICSDLQRPQGVYLLGAMGAAAVFGPRATPTASYERWRRVVRTDAQLGAVYVISVNRPAPEGAVPIGGASIAASPDGEVLLESTEPVACLTLEAGAVERAREDYPGYLDVRSDLYARAWNAIAGDIERS
jgi:predicted amidohydrolase